MWGCDTEPAFQEVPKWLIHKANAEQHKQYLRTSQRDRSGEDTNAARVRCTDCAAPRPFPRAAQQRRDRPGLRPSAASDRRRNGQSSPSTQRRSWGERKLLGGLEG